MTPRTTTRSNCRTIFRHQMNATDEPLDGAELKEASVLGDPQPSSARQHRHGPDGSAHASCTVVVVSFRTGPLLIDCLRAALTQDGVEKVVLVDNGNPVASRREVDALQVSFGHLQIVRGHGNVGFASGCNLGVRLATTDFILLLNPDCVLRPGVIRRGLEVLKQHPDADALTVRIENADGTEQRGSRRKLMTPWTCVVEQLRLDRWLGSHSRFERINLNESQSPTCVTAVECISGAFMLMPRSAYEHIGGMDEDYFLHVEDVDLCYRIRQSGRSILYVPDVAVTHLKGSSRVFPLFLEWHKAISASKYFKKHFQRQSSDLVLRLITLGLFLRLSMRAVPITVAWASRRITRRPGPRSRR